jgi:hypothetical protein
MSRRFFLDDFLAALAGRLKQSDAADVVMHPPRDAGYPLRHAVGVTPLEDELLDTTTVRGIGVANMDLDPLVEAYLAGLDRDK